MIPARAKSNLGILVEPNIFERTKVVIGKAPKFEDFYYSSSIDIGTDLITISSSYNHDNRYEVTKFSAYDGRIDMYSYESGSSVYNISGSAPNFEGSSSEFLDSSYELSLWQRLNRPDKFYATASVTYGDTKYFETLQPVLSGSVVRGNNQRMEKYYTTANSASIDNFFSSSFYNVDTDYLLNDVEARIRSYFEGVKNTALTTFDGGPPIEITLTSPTKLVKKAPGESSLDTGEGTVAKFKPKRRKKNKKVFFSRVNVKPRNAEQAIEEAREQSGGQLTPAQFTTAIDRFKLGAGITGKKNSKKRKKKRKKKFFRR